MEDGGTMLMEEPITEAQDSPEEPDLGYRVQLETFSGPMDLLLYLVRRAEVDIQDIPIAEITDQFLTTIRAWEEMDLDLAGDFILMAATLLEIKSRTIAPVEEGEQFDDDEELIDPRADLIRQLLSFRQCKDWAHRLRSCEERFALVHHRRQAEEIPEAEDEEAYDLENADPYQLFRMWDEILADIAGHSPRTVVYDDVPIEDRVRQIIGSMAEAREGKLSWLMAHVDTRIKRIGVFVALMECVRKRALEAIQHEQYADVYLHFREEADRALPTPLPEEQPVDDTSVDGEEKKRRRRRGPLQLMTYHAEMQAVQEMLPEIEELIQVETEEDRFRRELNERTGVDQVIGTVKHFDQNLHEHLVLRRICAGPLPADAVVEEAPTIELPEEDLEEGADDAQPTAVETADPIAENPADQATASADEDTVDTLDDEEAPEDQAIATTGEEALDDEEDDDDFGDFDDEYDDDEDDDDDDEDDD